MFMSSMIIAGKNKFYKITKDVMNHESVQVARIRNSKC